MQRGYERVAWMSLDMEGMRYRKKRGEEEVEEEEEEYGVGSLLTFFQDAREFGRVFSLLNMGAFSPF
jgi:hypothetical protein